jgi:hypothetical protein
MRVFANPVKLQSNGNAMLLLLVVFPSVVMFPTGSTTLLAEAIAREHANTATATSDMRIVLDPIRPSSR